jgi:hypothetical protein
MGLVPVVEVKDINVTMATARRGRMMLLLCISLPPCVIYLQYHFQRLLVHERLSPHRPP